MISKKDICLGMSVTFTRAYSSNPKERMPGKYGGEAVPLFSQGDLVPEHMCRGIVVGKRTYIMSNWYRERDPEEGCYIVGKRRGMLIVAYNLHNRFVLVAPEDAEALDTWGEVK